MDRVLVLDFGSQYNQLIARRVREHRVYSEIVAHDISPDEIRSRGASALILSGGPASVRARRAPMSGSARPALDYVGSSVATNNPRHATYDAFGLSTFAESIL